MALVQNELSGLKLDCSLGSDAVALADPECAEAVDPFSYIREAGFDYLTIGECVGCLFAYTAVCHTIGYIGKLAASLVGQPRRRKYPRNQPTNQPTLTNHRPLPKIKLQLCGSSSAASN